MGIGHDVKVILVKANPAHLYEKVAPRQVRAALHKLKLARVMAACHGAYFFGLAFGNHSLYYTMAIPLFGLSLIVMIIGEE